MTFSRVKGTWRASLQDQYLSVPMLVPSRSRLYTYSNCNTPLVSVVVAGGRGAACSIPQLNSSCRKFVFTSTKFRAENTPFCENLGRKVKFEHS